MAKILLVDDDRTLAESISGVLTSSGYVVDKAHSVEEAEPLLDFAYDMYILDWTMPGKHGIDLLETLRQRGCKSPILMLTGLGSIDHKTRGFDAGADDYLTKPFNSQELIIRVRALLRRPAGFENDELNISNVLLNTRTSKVFWFGKELKLTKQEIQLLEVLMRNKDHVLSHQSLVERAWSSMSESSPDTVRVHMARLRKKFIGAEVECPIQTVHGQGYVFSSGRDAEAANVDN